MMSAEVREDIGQHLPALRAFAVSLTQDTALADDMVQDAVTKAWINFHQYRPGTNLRAWLFTILRNTFYSYVRKRRIDVASLDEIPKGQVSVPPGHESVLALHDFLSAFRTLSFEQREALLLVGALGFTYEEAADLCETPVGTLKSRTHRARVLLSEQLQLSRKADATVSL